MRRRRLCVVVVPLMLVACASREPLLIDAWLVHRELLPHSQDARKRVELFWTRPAGDGPYPVLLLIHGHKDHLRNGGEFFVNIGRLRVIATRGYVAAALSQPGYGNSDGPPDYCGRFTQDAAMVAVEFLRRQPFVDPKRVALYGYSRGAIVASMVATKDPRLAAVVLSAGAYDFFSWYPTRLPTVNANIRLETGASAEAFRARSAIYHVDKIRARVLLLHGARDERVPVLQAEAFAERLKASGVAVTLKIFPSAKHGIPIDEQYREIYPFLEEALR